MSYTARVPVIPVRIVWRKDEVVGLFCRLRDTNSRMVQREKD